MLSGDPRLRARTIAGRVRRRTLARRGFESRLVWIFGSPRSGSTWLLQLLGECDPVVTVNEPLIGSYLSPFLSDQPGFDADQLDETSFTIRRLHRHHPDHFLAAEFEHVWRPVLGRLIRERFFSHVLRYPANAPLRRTLVVIKEPNGSESADVILGGLPHSRMLFLLRDGRDVVDSDLAARLSGAWLTKVFPGTSGIPESDRLQFVKLSAHKWLWRTQVVQQAYAAHRGPKLLLRYEDLREDPAVYFRALFTWLGLSVSDERLRELIDRYTFEHLPGEAKGPGEFFRAAKPGLWRENLSSEEQEAVERILGPKLAELGYGDEREAPDMVVPSPRPSGART